MAKEVLLAARAILNANSHTDEEFLDKLRQLFEKTGALTRALIANYQIPLA